MAYNVKLYMKPLCRDEARSADAERVKAERQIKKSEYEVLQRDAKKETDVSSSFKLV